MLAALLLNQKIGGNAFVTFLVGANLRAEATPPEVRLELLDDQFYDPQGRAGTNIKFVPFIDAAPAAPSAEVFTKGGTFTVDTETSCTVSILGAESYPQAHPVRLLVGSSVEAPTAEIVAAATAPDVIPGVSVVVDIEWGKPLRDGSTRVIPAGAAEVVMLFGASARAMSEVAAVQSYQNPSDEELIMLVRALRRRRVA